MAKLWVGIHFELLRLDQEHSFGRLTTFRSLQAFFVHLPVIPVLSVIKY